MTENSEFEKGLDANLKKLWKRGFIEGYVASQGWLATTRFFKKSTYAVAERMAEKYCLAIFGED